MSECQIHRFDDEKEDREHRNQESNKRIDKQSDFHIQKLIVEFCSTSKVPDQRRNEVGDDRLDEFIECDTSDNTDGQIDHIAAHDEVAKFFQNREHARILRIVRSKCNTLSSMELLKLNDEPAQLDANATLAGSVVQLVPFTIEAAQHIQPWVDPDHDALFEMLASPISFGGAGKFSEWLCARRDQGVVVPFTMETVAGDFIGYSRFLHIDLRSRTVHIGGTWISPPFRGTGVNTEAKLLMLQHAFEVGGFNRVTIQTGSTNARSRRAIEKLGAQYEGDNRANFMTQAGVPRDTSVYSIIRPEWPRVRVVLQQQLEPLLEVGNTALTD